MVALSKPTLDTGIPMQLFSCNVVIEDLVFLVQSTLELFDAFMIVLEMVVTNTTSIITVGKVLITFDCFFKVRYSQLVVAHVLVDCTSSNKYCLIIKNL